MQRKSYLRQYEEQLGKLLAVVKAEGTELAVRFGFQRGPLLKQAVLDERDWWEENEKDFEQFYLLEVDLDEDRPEVIRIACLTSLDLVLGPEVGRHDSDAETWMESLDEHMEALRQAVRRAAGPPSAEMMAAWTKTRAARARIAELEREIAELKCTVRQAKREGLTPESRQALHVVRKAVA